MAGRARGSLDSSLCCTAIRSSPILRCLQLEVVFYILRGGPCSHAIAPHIPLAFAKLAAGGRPGAGASPSTKNSFPTAWAESGALAGLLVKGDTEASRIVVVSSITFSMAAGGRLHYSAHAPVTRPTNA